MYFFDFELCKEEIEWLMQSAQLLFAILLVFVFLWVVYSMFDRLR